MKDMSEQKENENIYYELPERDSGDSSLNTPDSYVLHEEEPEMYSGVSHDDAGSGVDNDSSEYVLPEEEDEEMEDEEGINPAGSLDSTGGDGGGNPVAILLMFRTLLTPVDGWKALKRVHFSPDKFASACFYPLTALASVSQFAELLYGADTPLSTLIVSALRVFMSFFLGYFLILLVGKVLIKGSKSVFDSEFGKIFVMDSLSSLAVFYSLILFLPMLEPVLVFLPLWTIYAICRGVRFLRLPSDSVTIATCLLSLIIIGMPLVVGWLFSLVIPIQTV